MNFCFMLVIIVSIFKTRSIIANGQSGRKNDGKMRGARCEVDHGLTSIRLPYMREETTLTSSLERHIRVNICHSK